MILKIDKGVKIFAKGVAWITLIVFLGMTFIIMADVIVRNITGGALLGIYEIVERLLMVGVFASFAYTQTIHGHVHVTMLIGHLPKPVALIINALTNLFCAVVICILAYASVVQMNYSINTNTITGVLHIPYWPFFLIEAIAMIIYAVTVVWEVIKNIAALKNEEIAAEITASWD